MRKKNPKKHLDQDEIIEILDQGPAWILNVLMKNLFLISKCLENLEKIRHTSSPNPAHAVCFTDQ
jgi:hypothetical protein